VHLGSARRKEKVKSKKKRSFVFIIVRIKGAMVKRCNSDGWNMHKLLNNE